MIFRQKINKTKFLFSGLELFPHKFGWYSMARKCLMLRILDFKTRVSQILNSQFVCYRRFHNTNRRSCHWNIDGIMWHRPVRGNTQGNHLFIYSITPLQRK